MSTTSNLGITEIDANLRQPETPINVALQELDSVAGGLLVKSVAGSSNVTLTRAEALARVYKFTGALTGNISVLIPATGGAARDVVVWNASSGAFTLTVKTTTGGSAGIAVTQGKIRHLFHDGTDVRDSVSESAAASTFIGARVYNNANISVSNAGSGQALTFNTERYDTDTIHDTGSNTSRLTCKTAGKYRISAQLLWAANATGLRQIWIRLNGTTTLVQQDQLPTGANAFAMAVSTTWDLAVNDYVEFMVYQDSGGSLNVTSAGNYSPEFMMERVG